MRRRVAWRTEGEAMSENVEESRFRGFQMLSHFVCLGFDRRRIARISRDEEDDDDVLCKREREVVECGC